MNEPKWRWDKRPLVAPDGTVEVLHEGGEP